MTEQESNIKQSNMNNHSNSIPSTLKEDTLSSLITPNNIITPLTDKESNKESNEVQEEEDLSQLNYKTIYPLTSDSVMTEALDIFNDKRNRGSSSLILPSSLKISKTSFCDNEESPEENNIKSTIETKEFIEGLEKYPPITSSPISQKFNSSEMFNRKPSSSNPQTTSLNTKKSVNTSLKVSNNSINQSNQPISLNFSQDKLSQKIELENDEISYVIGSDSTSSYIPFEEESVLSDEMKRQSYCSISSDPNYRLSISSISNFDLNSKRQSLYSNSSNTNNTNSLKVNSNFSSEIIKLSSFTPPTSPVIPTKTIANNNNNPKTNMNPVITLSKSSNNSTSIINGLQVNNKDDKPLYDKSILRPVSSIEVKEEKSSIDKSFFSQIENKDDSVPFDRSFLRSIEPKEEKISFDKAFFSQLENKDENSTFNRSFLRQVENKDNKDSKDKLTKDEKTLYDRTSLRQFEMKNGKISNDSSVYSKTNNIKSKSKGITVNTKSDILDDKNNINNISRGRPVNPFRENIFVRRSHSQGSNASSPISKEINSPTEIQKFNRRKNRTSDPCTPTSLRHNKSTSNITNISSTLEVPTPERMESLPLKSKVNRLKSSENNLRRSNSYSCIQMTSSSTPSSSSIIDIRPPLKSSNSMILSSNIKTESTKLNPLVNSDEETQTPQKVIDSLNKLNVESKKTTMSDIPKIIFSIAEFVGVILVDKTNHLLNYFEERYPKLRVIISILQVITRYIPTAIVKSSEILQQGYNILMNRIEMLREYCELNNIPFPDINQFIRIFNILKNQIIEKIMLARNGQLQLPSNISEFMSRIQEILSRVSSRKGGLPFSKSDIKTISISGPVGGHPMGSGESFQFSGPTSSSISITLVQDDQEKKRDSIPIKKTDEPQEVDSEIIFSNRITTSSPSSPSSPYDESSIITKSLSTDTTVKDGSFPFFKRRPEKNINNNRLLDDITSVANNRNSIQSSDSSYVSDSSHSFISGGKRNGMVGVLQHHHQHQSSTTSNDSVTEPIVKENVNVNNLIELFEKQMNQVRVPSGDLNENESFLLPSQPPQTNPRTHSLKYSLKQRQQKTSSMVSDDMVSISTSDSSEFDKVDFDDNLGRKPTVNLNYTSGHRRSHSQPDDSFLDDDQEERENEISLSQEVSSELRHKFAKGQESRERYKEQMRSQSMIINREKPQKSNQNELIMAVKNLKPVSSSTRLSVPSSDIRNTNIEVVSTVSVEKEKVSGPIPIVENQSAPAPKTKREKIVEELFQTEKTYVKELASIVHLYLDPLDTVPGHFLDMQEYKTLFGNLRDIFDFHNEAFAPRLEKSCFPERNKSIVPPPSVGSFFQLNAPVLANLYGEYYTNSNMANNFLTRIQNSKSSRFSTSLVNNKPKEAIFKKENKKRLKKFKTFLQWVCGQPEHTQMSLQGYLLLPVQRLPRYLLLLEQLLKNTSENDREYRDLNKAKEAIRMVVEQCNERIRHFEEKQRVIEIISNIRLCSSNVHSIGGKVMKHSSGSYNKRLLLDTVPAKTKVEFFVKLQNLTKLDELHLIKEGKFQIYKVKQINSKATNNSKNKNNRRVPTDFSSSPALRAQRAAAERIAQKSSDKLKRITKESQEDNKENNDSTTMNNSTFSPSLNSISPMIYNTVMKMSMSPKLRPSSTSTSTSSTPPSSSIKKRKNRRRSSLESLSPPFIKMLQEEASSISETNKINRQINKIQEDENVTENRKRSLSTTIEGNETDEITDPPKHHSMSTIDMKESLSLTDTLMNPSIAIWEQVYLINNNLVEVLSSTNELVRIMELVKPKVGHLPNSILNAGCQVDVIIENGIQMLTVCDGHVMIYLMGLKDELFEWKEAIEKIIQ
ncbi:hypothetical protein PIROE2DRAFT_69044 [Piromyces sp. E2]|nr:hypothetical protein PIROE2DRAFT_69044 [Piromyces sp. E2]|eukprot:OUM65722.1 hypothetical protein PIROE2DRAFT_69044 [Piromyces sp. E2]